MEIGWRGGSIVFVAIANVFSPMAPPCYVQSMTADRTSATHFGSFYMAKRMDECFARIAVIEPGLLETSD